MNPLLVALGATACYGVAVWGVALVRDRGPAARLSGPRPIEETEGRRSLVVRLYDYLSDRLAPRALGLLSDAQRAAIRRKLDAAGKPNGMTLEGYAGRKAAYTVIFATTGILFLVQGYVLPGIMCVVFGWFWLDFWLRSVARARQGRIERDLPDFLDILAVTVSAGVGFRPALARVADAVGGPLAQEILTALRQMDLGLGRRQALEAIRARNSSESLGQFVTALLQAEELGVPLSDALGNLAEDMRRSFYQQARRRAAKAAPRVSLIVSLLVVPGAIILIIASVLAGSDLSPGELLGG